MTRHQPVRGEFAPARLEAVDPAPHEVAAVQAACAGWLVMWSWSRRVWTAFGSCTSEPVIVDDPDPLRLLDRCREIGLAAAFGRAANR